MNFPLYIAKRYLVSKKSRNIINIISAISVTGVSIGTMALIIILSVHNGFDGLMKSLFNTFDPDIKITATHGKSIPSDSDAMKKVKALKEVAYWSDVIEENALLKYSDKQCIVTVKGVEESFSEMTGVDSMMEEGAFYLKNDGRPYAVIGEGVAWFLAFRLNFVQPLTIYAARRGVKAGSSPENAIRSEMLEPVGIFKIHPELDVQYIIVPLAFARSLFDYPDEVTSVELSLQKNTDAGPAIEKISRLLGPGFEVKDRVGQHEFLNKTIKSEKWVIFLILTFVLLIASFNIVGSLTMLIIDKKKDVEILRGLGATLSTIRKIFLLEGWLISVAGAVIGLALGFLLAFSQQQFGWVKLQGSGSFIIDAYPVEMHFTDFVLILATVLIIGFLAAWYPIRYITRKYLQVGH
ncbi:MAG: FtsX-like permease family protein [Bacteroidetes bacterium]|nr:FtsX-like permease family protein [Bacteroidota bacterium]